MWRTTSLASETAGFVKCPLEFLNSVLISLFSVYVSGGSNIDRETTRLRAQSLFGCGSVDNNSINVLCDIIPCLKLSYADCNDEP